MPLINLVVVLIVICIGLWLINRFIPMASSINAILNLVVVVAGWDLGIAGSGTVGGCDQFSILALTHSG